MILTLAEELGIAVGEEVDDGGSVLLLAAEVLLPDVGGDERPELIDVDARAPVVVAQEMEVCKTSQSFDVLPIPREIRSGYVRLMPTLPK